MLGSVPLAAGMARAQEGDEADPLESARKQIERSIARMEEFDLPMSAEPAFVFRP